MLPLEEIFPPFALTISCGPLELRVLRDDDLPEFVVRLAFDEPGASAHVVGNHPLSSGQPQDWPAAVVPQWPAVVWRADRFTVVEVRWPPGA